MPPADHAHLEASWQGHLGDAVIAVSNCCPEQDRRGWRPDLGDGKWTVTTSTFDLGLAKESSLSSLPYGWLSVGHVI